MTPNTKYIHLRPRPNKHRRARAFTLIEALVSSVILTAAVAALGGLCTQCISQTARHRNLDLAWQIMDRQLTAIDTMGIDLFLNEAVTSGEIDEFGPTFRWQTEIQEQDDDQLMLLRLTVTWQENNRPRKIVADTMFNGTAALSTLSEAP